ncbi:hypothetical protein K439DRAFT_77593 [Ramaria rubella]|nr:hypothetical protein K439DRAFT_77593 [Ramaria rubella]
MASLPLSLALPRLPHALAHSHSPDSLAPATPISPTSSAASHDLPAAMDSTSKPHPPAHRQRHNTHTNPTSNTSTSNTSTANTASSNSGDTVKRKPSRRAQHRRAPRNTQRRRAPAPRDPQRSFFGESPPLPFPSIPSLIALPILPPPTRRFPARHTSYPRSRPASPYCFFFMRSTPLHYPIPLLRSHTLPNPTNTTPRTSQPSSPTSQLSAAPQNPPSSTPPSPSSTPSAAPASPQAANSAPSKPSPQPSAAK